MDKKVLILFFLSLLFLLLVSSVSATNIYENNMTLLSDSGDNYETITADLSNEDIQSKFDNAKDGDTFEFTDNEYNDISLVVDKKLNIVSKKIFFSSSLNFSIHILLASLNANDFLFNLSFKINPFSLINQV